MSVNCRASRAPAACAPEGRPCGSLLPLEGHRPEPHLASRWPAGWAGQASPRLDLGTAPPSAVGKHSTVHEAKSTLGSLAPTSQVGARGHRGLGPTAEGTFIPEDMVPRGQHLPREGSPGPRAASWS